MTLQINNKIQAMKLQQLEDSDSLPHHSSKIKKVCRTSHHEPSILLDAIHDQQFYIALTSLFLRIGKESGLDSGSLESLSKSLLLAKGLDEGQMLSHQNIQHEYSNNQFESYDILEKGSNATQQLALIQKLEHELLLKREKDNNFKVLEKFLKFKRQEIDPKNESLKESRKDRFKKIVNQKYATKKVESSNFFNHSMTQIFLNTFKAHNECYQTISSIKYLKTMFGHSYDQDTESYSPIFNVIFDKNQKVIISGGQEGLIKMWGKQTGQLIGSLKGHTEFLNKIDVSECNKYLLSAAGDGVRFWDLKKLKPLGGWKTQSIVDIASIHQNDRSTFFFCDSQKFYCLDELVMLQNKDKRLQSKNFKSFDFTHLLQRQSAIVNIISISMSKEYFLLAFENGCFIVFKYQAIKQILRSNTDLSQSFLLPALVVTKAHHQQIMEVKWSNSNSYFTTGSRDGKCSIWEFKNQKNLVWLTSLQANKLLNRRKKRNFACTYICWNCTFTHLAAAFQEIMEEEDNDRGLGEVVIYNTLQKRVTAQLSKDISLKLHGVKAMDAHPFYPNILLICEAEGNILLFDIFLCSIVNIFEERGYHIMHPQFGLVPSDCKFFKNGLGFIISNEYGAISLYGYDSKQFFDTCPDQQFFFTDFEKFTIEDSSMKSIPFTLGFQQDINNFVGTRICNIRGQPYEYALNLNRQQYLNQIFEPESEKQKHKSEIKVDQIFLRKLQQNIKQSENSDKFYANVRQQLRLNSQDILFYERQRQNNNFQSLCKSKLEKLKWKNNPEAIQYSPHYMNKSQQKVGKTRKLKRHSQIQRVNYTDEFDYHESNEESFDIVSDGVEEAHQLDEEYSENSDRRQARRNRRYPQRERNNFSYNSYTHQDQSNQSEDQRQKEKTRKRNFREYNRINEEIQQENRPRKKVKIIQQDQERNDFNLEEQQNSCYRCQLVPESVRCKNCRFSQQFCKKCSTFRGSQIQGNYRCFIDIFLDNNQPEEDSYVEQTQFRLTNRQNSFIPQHEDHVRFFFQGYEQFLAQNIKKLNNKVVDQNSLYRLLPHAQNLQLYRTPLCKVVDIQYYFPRQLEQQLNTMENKRSKQRRQNSHILMLIKLEVLQKDQENDSGHFWVFFTPGSDFILREQVFQQININNALSCLELNQLINYDNEEYQVVDLSPFEDAFPDSIWNYVKLRKTEGKRLRGNTKDIERRVNVWNVMPELTNISFNCEMPNKQTSKLAQQIQVWISEGNQYSEFIDYVDFDIYPLYRSSVEVGMCLRTIHQRIGNSYYSSSQSLEFDINLISKNSITFNGENHRVTIRANQLCKKMISILHKEFDGSNSKKALQTTTKKQRKRRIVFDDQFQSDILNYSRKSNDSQVRGKRVTRGRLIIGSSDEEKDDEMYENEGQNINIIGATRSRMSTRNRQRDNNVKEEREVRKTRNKHRQ